ncbi:MAG: rhodanese-like domain-containing protein [Candidatus Binatia bacterium]
MSKIMRIWRNIKGVLSISLVLLSGLMVPKTDSWANPNRYSQFAQQEGAIKVDPEFIHLEELVDEIIDKKKPLIVDVRRQEEYQQAHIKGSVSIPLGEIGLRLAEIPKDRLVVLYCACPRHLASLAYRTLYGKGFRNMKVLFEGFPGWIQKGYPVEGKLL